MADLVAVGGAFFPTEAIRPVQGRLDDLCRETGFPEDDEFKWSPGQELWMRDNLHGKDRENFFVQCLATAAEHGGQAVIVVVDRSAQSATGADTPEEDATRLFLERASNRFRGADNGGVVIVDRPPGGRAAENRFLANCIDHLQDEDTFAVPKRFALPVLTTQSRFVRLLQLADLITSCTLAFVAGEPDWSPPVFEKIKSLLPCDRDRIGGVGLKIHPDGRYRNLYHWFLGDEVFRRGPTVHELPSLRCSYAGSPRVP